MTLHDPYASCFTLISHSSCIWFCSAMCSCKMVSWSRSAISCNEQRLNNCTTKELSCEIKNQQKKINGVNWSRNEHITSGMKMILRVCEVIKATIKMTMKIHTSQSLMLTYMQLLHNILYICIIRNAV